MPIHVTPADDLAAAIIRARDGDRQVLLHGGAYAEVALTLTPDDSGLTLAAAPGETPVLYGGRRLTGWTQQGDWWSAAVPEVLARSSDVRSCTPRMLSPSGISTSEIRMVWSSNAL